VRFSLMLLTREGQDTKLSPDRFEMGWRFGNKIWNAARFVLGNLAGERSDGTLASAARLEDRWILARLEATRAEVTAALDEYRLHDAATALYRFVWNEFCDWYVELVKPRLLDPGDASAPAARGTLARALTDMLALLHPFTPYLTEVLWKALAEALGEERGLLMNSAWPDGADGEELASGGAADEALADMSVIQDLVRAVRSVRALTTIGERKPLTARIAAPREQDRRVLEEHAGTVRALAFLDSYEVADAFERPPSSACAVAGGIEAFVRLGEEVDLDKLKGVLERRLTKLQGGIGGARKKLENEKFLAHADPEVVKAERERLAEMELEGDLLRRNLEGL
jgi:valyl-tRNA synthetase